MATAAGLLGWIIVEWIRGGKPTLVGASSGAVAGLVAITPACGFIAPLPAVILGLVAGAVCALAVSLKYKLGYDDSLDVVGVHLIGGLWGTLAIGLFQTTYVNDVGVNGLFYGGGVDQLGKQAIGAGAVLAYSFVATLIIGYAIKVTIGWRIDDEAEATGIDESEHAETAYEFSGLRTGSSSNSKAADASAGSKVPANASKEGATP